MLAALGVGNTAMAQSGGGYDLSWNTVDGGGVTFATGGGYTLTEIGAEWLAGLGEAPLSIRANWGPFVGITAAP